MNDATARTMIEANNQKEIYYAQQIDKWTNEVISGRGITGQIKGACCKSCQALFGGNVQDGFKFVSGEKPEKPLDEPTVEMTATPEIHANGKKTGKRTAAGEK